MWSWGQNHGEDFDGRSRRIRSLLRPTRPRYIIHFSPHYFSTAHYILSAFYFYRLRHFSARPFPRTSHCPRPIFRRHYFFPRPTFSSRPIFPRWFRPRRDAAPSRRRRYDRHRQQRALTHRSRWRTTFFAFPPPFFSRRTPTCVCVCAAAASAMCRRGPADLYARRRGAARSDTRTIFARR